MCTQIVHRAFRGHFDYKSNLREDYSESIMTLSLNILLLNSFRFLICECQKGLLHKRILGMLNAVSTVSSDIFCAFGIDVIANRHDDNKEQCTKIMRRGRHSISQCKVGIALDDKNDFI